MKKTILEIYALLVSFVSLIWSIFMIGTICYSMVRIINPELTLPSWSYGKYQSNSLYISQMGSENKTFGLTDDQITARRKEEFEIALREEKRGGFQDLIKNSIYLVITVFVFFFHWRMAKQNRLLTKE